MKGLPRLLTLLVLAVVLIVAIVTTTAASSGFEKPPKGPRAEVTPVSWSYLPVVLNLHRANLLKGVGATYVRHSTPNQPCSWLDVPGGIRWYYNWSYNPPDCSEVGVESVPTLWDEASIGQTLGGNSEWLMGFNEPEMVGQANLTPGDAADYWVQVENNYPTKRLVSPGVTRLDWLQNWYSIFVSRYSRAPRIDAIAIHCYGAYDVDYSLNKCQALVTSTIAQASAWDVEVWLTEWAWIPCYEEEPDASIRFMKEMVHWLCQGEQERVTRYAWFQLSYMGTEPWAFGPSRNTSLVDYYSGEITELGQAY